MSLCELRDQSILFNPFTARIDIFDGLKKISYIYIYIYIYRQILLKFMNYICLVLVYLSGIGVILNDKV